MTTPSLTIYAWSHSSRAERCIWAAREAGVEHEVKRLKPRPDTPEYAELKSINPSAKIPTVVHGQTVLTESLPTCEYIARLAPSKRLMPETDAELYDYSRLMHFLLTEVEAYLWTATQSATLHERYPWPEGTTGFALKMTQKNLNALRHYVGESFACCDRFTIADIMLSQIAGWATSFKLELPEAVEALHRAAAGRPSRPETMGG